MVGHEIYMSETPLDVLKPEHVTLPVAPVKITEEEARTAAKALGLKPVRVRRLSRHAVIGKYMEQLGAAQIGVGKLLVTDQQIEKGIKLCDRFLGDYAHVPEVVASLMRVRLGLTTAMMKAAHTLIKVNVDSGAVAESQPLVQSFPANAPVHVNTQVNIVAKEPSGA